MQLEPGGLLAWLIVGFVAGSLASALTGARLGCLLRIVVGIVGAVVGGLLASAAGLRGEAGLLGSILVAFVGAALFLAVLQGLAGRR